MRSTSYRHHCSEPTEASAPASEPLSRTDQLEYLADLTLELKEIADNLGCATLAGVLVVAHREAMIQAHRK